MISSLIYLLVVILIVSLIYWVISQFAPAPLQRIALVICVVIIVLALIFLLLPLAGMHHL